MTPLQRSPPLRIPLAAVQEYPSCVLFEVEADAMFKPRKKKKKIEDLSAIRGAMSRLDCGIRIYSTFGQALAVRDLPKKETEIAPDAA